MIEFKGVYKNFKDKCVLSNISFEIEKGQIVVLIGASGCGKTTTLKMINRLIKPTKGQIFINGEDISKKDIISLRRQMGYVIQQTGLFPHMTIEENIQLIPKIEKYNIEDMKKKTSELMEMVGLNYEEFKDRYPTELSGGQQQRVGVSRAFITNPEIILMDEPFSALDPLTRTSLQDELIYLQSEFKKTIVFVTHDMDEAIKIADKICIMNKGEIVQYDTPENILKNPANDFVAEFVGKNRLWGSPEYIKAEDIMIDNPITCFDDLTVFKSMEKMRANKVDTLMVIEKKSKILKGIIKSKEIRKIDNKSLLAKDVMTKDYYSINKDSSIIDILKLINEENISIIPVINDDGALQGIITKTSLVNILNHQYIEEEVM